MRSFRPDEWRDLLAYLSLPEVDAFEPGKPIDAATARGMAVRALVAHAFSSLGAHRVVASCNPDNVASWRVLERAGFVREARLRRNIWFRRDPAGDPLWQDTFVYGLVADDLRS